MKIGLIISAILFVLASLNTTAQSPSFQWAKKIGGTNNDVPTSSVVDANGNVYTTGFFEGTADFDPGSGTYNLTSVGSLDIYVSKLDASGNFIWAKRIGGVDDDYASVIVVDANGNVYTTGYFVGTCNFDPGSGTYNLTSFGIADIFVSKLDASGNFVWAKQIGGTDDDQATSLVIDNSGNVYTTGGFKGTADFDPGPGVFSMTSVGMQTIFISKLDAAGNFIWAKQFGGASGTTLGISIDLDIVGNVYTTGRLNGTADFDPGPGVYNLISVGIGTEDIFVSKLDASGNFVWAKLIGGVDDEYSNSMVVDINGNVYTTGYFNGMVDFDPGSGTYNLTSAGSLDIFVSKLDASGNFISAKRMGGANDDYPSSIKVDAIGNVYITGYFNGTADFDPGSGIYNLTSIGSSDIFVSKLNISGNFLWAKQMGGQSDDSGNAIAVDAIGNIYITGAFYGTADFDPGSGTYNLTSAGSSDIFVVKLGAQAQNQFTTGSIVILRVGDGIISPSGDYPVFLDEFSISGNLIQSIPLPTTVSGSNNQLVLPGLINAQGYLTRSYDKNYLVMTGYARDLGGSGSLASIGTIDKFKNINTTTVLSDYLTPRSATSTDGTKFWMVGTNGVRYANKGASTSVLVSSNQQTNRSIIISNGQLYASNGGALASCIGTTLTGLPENAGDSLTPLPGIPGTSAYQFVFFDQNTSIPGPDVLYIALESSVQKYSFVGSTWVLNGNIASSPGALWRGITGQIDATNTNHVALYITQNLSSPGKLLVLEDYSGYNGQFTGTPVVLATSPPNTNFKGIALSPGTSDLYYPTGVAPKIYISKAVLNVSQSQVVTGRDFTPAGAISLIIKNEFNELVGTNVPITYQYPGKFTYTLPVSNSFKHGEYSVYAIDYSTGKTTPVIKFRVNNPIQRKLWINKPLGTNSYLVNQIFKIQWGDYIAKTLAIGSSGFVQKSYKIETSSDNGNSWQIAINPVLINNAVAGKDNNNFSSSYHISAAGTYKIRITDNENPSNFNISESFVITNSSSHGFFTQLGWDFSSPGQNVSSRPVGLAADGTCRIFVKLMKSPGNTKTVASINAQIKPASGLFTSTDMLGKILYATDTIAYSLQGNNANSTSTTYTATNNGNKNAYWFWLVAPDDFTQVLDNFQDNIRYINTEFIVTYTDNSTELISTNDQQPIEIVRPVLFLVHGLNGDEHSLENLAYTENVEGLKVYFNNESTPQNPLWKIVRRLHLYNYASFATNAELMLGISNVTTENYYSTFRYNLAKMHDKGYASNRVDYVCHSMGGAVARTIINKYPGSYRPGVSSPGYKNYDKGFINKLITISTPHNGSHLADMVLDRYNTSSVISALKNRQAYAGYFQAGVPSDAIKDLQAFHGGIRFLKSTNIKNHEIGSELDESNTISESILNTTNYFWTGALYKLLLPSNHTVHSFMETFYGNSEYLNRSDMIVPKSSQFPNTNQPINDLQTSQTAISTASIIRGADIDHIDIREDLIVGTRVFYLLNAPINSGYFADTVAANPNPGGTSTYLTSLIQDSAITYIDTGFIKIITPLSDSIVFIDSTIQVIINIKDTVHLQRVRLGFQSEFYDSYSKDSIQVFDIKIHSSAIGKNIVLAEATYDSSGVIINHVDTVTLNVKSLDILTGFYLYPKSQYLNKQHSFHLTKNAIYTNYIGELINDIDSLNFIIMDTNVVRYDSLQQQFITKDTGTTHIIFNYKNFTDTAFIYISEPEDNGPVLPVTLISFNGYAKPVYNLLEWKTTTEINFSHFKLQRSLDGASWTDVARINSRSGSGGGTLNYDFKDSLISNSLTFYRLLLVDLDGKYKTSNTVLIRRSSGFGAIKVFPNPVTKSEVFIDLGSTTNTTSPIISMIDLSGKVVKVINPGIIQNNIIRLDLFGIKPSIYMLKVQKGDNVQVFKLAILE
jgi:triacylglycerol esterase/lipase EstA (alpha/beta hydrolase family)